MMNMRQTARIGEIELLRFMAACIVMLVHACFYSGCMWLPPGGAICVDFFFVLSGYLMAAHIEKKRFSEPTAGNLPSETYAYLWKRLCSFWPEVLVSSCIGLLVFACSHLFAVKETLEAVTETIVGNLMLLRMIVDQRGVNGVTWYLSSLLMCSGILYPLIRRYGFSPVLPVFSLLLLSEILNCKGVKFVEPTEWMGWTYTGNIRAFAEMSIGASLFPLVQYLSRLQISRIQAFLLAILKWGCYGIVLLYCLRPSLLLAPLTISAIIGALVLSLSHLCLDADCYQHAWIMWLGRFSLPLYLSHIFWAKNLCLIFPCVKNGWLMLLIYCLFSVLTAVVVMLSGKLLRRLVSAGV